MNAVYEVRHAGVHYILRLTPPSLRTPELVKSELHWMRFLFEHGVSVSQPVPSSRGDFVECVEHDGQSYAACVFEKASGRQISYGSAAGWCPDLHRALGRLIGQMHRLATVYTPPTSIAKRLCWDEGEVQDVLALAKHADAAGRRELAEVMRWARDLPRPAHAFGLVHNDIHIQNFLVDDGRITLFDFDGCTYNWFAYDLAIPIYYIGHLPHVAPELSTTDRQRELLDSLLDGYDEEFAIDHEWVDRIFGFVRLRRILIYIYCLRWVKTRPDILTSAYFARHQAALGTREPLL